MEIKYLVFHNFEVIFQTTHLKQMVISAWEASNVGWVDIGDCDDSAGAYQRRATNTCALRDWLTGRQAYIGRKMDIIVAGCPWCAGCVCHMGLNSMVVLHRSGRPCRGCKEASK